MVKEAWFKIENEYNSQSMKHPRTAAVLKNKYDNIVSGVEKQYADKKVFIRDTGGRPTKTFPSTSLTMTVGDMSQSKSTGEPSDHDSNCVYPLWKTESIEYKIDGRIVEKRCGSEEEGVIVNDENTFSGK